jgi:hypothetical protein
VSRSVRGGPCLLFHDEFPLRFHFLLLWLAQVGCQLLDPVRLFQADSEGGRYVDVADVGVQLGIVEGELGESEVNVGVGVAGVEDARLDEGRPAGVEQEGQFLAARDPDAAAGDLGDGGGESVAWAA